MKLETLKLKEWLPLAGIIAFSGCSVNALAHLFIENAKHDTWLFWGAAVLVELCTAWLVWSSVEMLRKVTKSKISKQDRLFYGIVLGLFLLLAIPSLTLSIVANAYEFDGDPLLSCIFPVLSVACAAGAALPQAVQKREQTKVDDKEKDDKDKADKKKKKADKRRLEAEVGPVGMQILRILAANPGISQAEIGQEIGKKRQTAGYHIRKMEEKEIIRQDPDNGQEWEILVKLP